MYYVYILNCKDETLYCGYTNDLDGRLIVHNSGKGAKYTKSRLPVEIIYNECFETKNEAMKREYLIKQLTRQEKLLLIKTQQKPIVMK